MNINFEAAIRYINIGESEQAIKELKEAIRSEIANNSENISIQYRCVLGELLHDLQRDDEAAKEFKKVIDYCKRTGSLPNQEKIAEEFLKAINGNITITAEQLNIPGSTELMSMPVQNNSTPKKVSRRKK